jgi:hypothetical protein
MLEPVYVLENGQRIPYVPIEIKDHREAYAATLHVLFKHVADFHICVVKTFSKKYGIPEDEIMQTIQESDEFKHMHVDPVLHHDGLGYLSPAHQQPQEQEPQAPAQQEPQAPAQQAPAQQAPAQQQQQQQQQAPAQQQQQQEPQAPQQQQQQQEPVVKKRIVKKKLPANPAPVIVVAAAPDQVVAAAPDPVAVPAVEKRKVIRKKAPIPPVAMDMTTERNDPPTKPADAHTPPLNTPKKIIRKKS